MKTNIQMGVSGRFKLTAKSSRGVRVLGFVNLITNSGLDAIGLGTFYLYDECRIGTGTAEPTPADIGLTNHVSTKTTVGTKNATGGMLPSPHLTHTTTFRFNEGVATGTWSEIGMWSTANRLLSRALIKDEDGLPTSITILADETLDVDYFFTWHLDGSQHTGTIELDGVEYNYISQLTGLTAAINSLSQSARTPRVVNTGNYQNGRIADGVVTMPPVDSTSRVTTQTDSSMSVQPYQLGSHKREYSIHWALSQGNVASFTSVVVGTWALNEQQVASYLPMRVIFDKPIPKTAAYKLSLDFSFSWGRYEDPEDES